MWAVVIALGLYGIVGLYLRWPALPVGLSLVGAFLVWMLLLLERDEA